MHDHSPELLRSSAGARSPRRWSHGRDSHRTPIGRPRKCAPSHVSCRFRRGHLRTLLRQEARRRNRQRPSSSKNKPGAFGNIANEYVARSKPDGYTIYIAPTNLLTIAPALYKKLNYDPLKDYDSACTLFKLPFLLNVAADSPYKSVADLVAAMKKKGDKGSYGSVSTVSLISAELFKVQFGLETVEVKYKESANSMNDLLSGTLDFAFIDPAGTAAMRNSGKLRALAVTTKERVSSLPDIPVRMKWAS